MAERKPKGYWTLERVYEIVDELNRTGVVLAQAEFFRRYPGAYNVIYREAKRRKSLAGGEAAPSLTYCRILEERGIEPKYRTHIFNKDELMDRYLERRAGTYEELERDLGISHSNMSHFLNSAVGRRKYRKLDTGTKQAVRRGALSNSNPFSTNSRFIIYRRDRENFFPQYLAEMIRPDVGRNGKDSITKVLKNKMSDRQMEEMWSYYRELEEMGVLLPQ